MFADSLTFDLSIHLSNIPKEGIHGDIHPHKLFENYGVLLKIFWCATLSLNLQFEI